MLMAVTQSGLKCPQSYLDASLAERAAICNGCGSAQAKFDLIPDTIYGLCITWACWIHDWMYHHGQTIQDKEVADEVFLSNLVRLIERDTCWWRKLLKPFMRRRALKYYEAVVLFGLDAFMAGKDMTIIKSLK